MEKYLKIKSLADEDRKELFKAISEKIAFKTETQMIRDVLRLPIHGSVTKNFVPTISDLFKVIEVYQIPYEFELKLRFTEREVVQEKPLTEMEKQQAQITNPELKQALQRKIISYPEVKRKTINPNDIPEIDI